MKNSLSDEGTKKKASTASKELYLEKERKLKSQKNREKTSVDLPTTPLKAKDKYYSHKK